MTAVKDDSAFKTYSEILKNNGITAEVKDVEVKIPDFTGDQFASQCNLVTVTFTDDSIPKIELFVKKAVNNPEYAAQIREMLMFEKEVRFFNLLLPALKTFADGKPSYDGFLDRILPKCFYADGELIVFDNVAIKGYSLLDKKVPHDFDVTKQVIKNMAQIHGTMRSYMLHMGEKTFMEKFDFISARSVWAEEATKVNGPWVQMPVNGAIRILKEKPTPGSEKALEHFLQFEKTAFQHTIQLYKLGNQKCPNVVIHGDLWNGNVMFQRNPVTKRPENSLIIDMQTVLFGTPAMDLQHYLFVASDPITIRTSWKKLLHIYYDELINIMSGLGQQVDFSYEELESDFRAKCQAGFFFALYHAYAFDCLELLGDMHNAEGDATENFMIQMNNSLDKLIGPKGEKYSKALVQIHQTLEYVKAGIQLEN